MRDGTKDEISQILDTGDHWLFRVDRQRSLFALENVAIVLFCFGVFVIWLSRVLVFQQWIAVGALVGVPIGFTAVYLFFGHRNVAELRAWRRRMEALRNDEASATRAPTDPSGGAPVGFLASMLELMDDMTKWTRELANRRVGWTWVYVALVFLSMEFGISYLFTWFALGGSPYTYPYSTISLAIALVVAGLVRIIVGGRRMAEAAERSRTLGEWRKHLEMGKDAFLQDLR